MTGWSYECPCGWSARNPDLEVVVERHQAHRRSHVDQIAVLARPREPAPPHLRSFDECSAHAGGVHVFTTEPSGRGVGYDDECACGAVANARPRY